MAWGYPSKGYPRTVLKTASELHPSSFPAKNYFFTKKCSAFSVMHLLSLHLIFPLPRPHAAVRFLSLRGERNQRRAGVATPRPQGLFCLSLAAHFSLSAWPACALRVAKRRPLYRNTRNLTIAKVPPHFWGYGLPVAGGQHPSAATGELLRLGEISQRKRFSLFIIR